MYNMQTENLSQHTLECAFITHLLALCGNKFFGKNYNPEHLAMYALFHDVPEILTGDLPTPVKYFNSDIKAAYDEIENSALQKLLSYIPTGLKEEYNDYLFFSNVTDDEKKLIKTADKLCAYIKARQELLAGNNEFSAAENKIKSELLKNHSDELKYFMDNCMEFFFKSIDDLNLAL